MKSMIPLLLSVMAILSGCGSDTDKAPEPNSPDPAPAPASIEDSVQPVTVANEVSESKTDDHVSTPENDADGKPIELAETQPAQAPKSVTLTNKGKQSSNPTTSPTLGAGNLWISGQANRSSTSAAEAASSFEWVDDSKKKPSSASQAALERMEAEQQAADLKVLEEAAADAKALKQLELERAKAQAAIDAAQQKANEEVTVVRSQIERELQALKKEQARILAEIETARTLAAERDAVNAKSQAELARLKEQTEKDKMSSEAARKEAEASALAKATAQKELAQLREQAAQEKKASEASAEAARMEAEANALATAKAQEEIERLKAEAEKQQSLAKAEAEAARKEAEQNAMAKAKAEAELKQARVETARIQADADQARARAESEAKAKAQVEAALLKAKADQAKSEQAAKEARATAPKPAPVPSVPKSTKPSGAVQLARLEQGALQKGLYGIQLGGQADIENLSGAKIELAAYFYDQKGNPLKDRDRVNRSSKGQVYVGKESVVPSNSFSLKDDLFIPYKQLDLTGKGVQNIQVELVLWEYSQGRGQRLSVAPRATFTHTPLATSDRANLVQREDISGTWQHDDTLITIVQQGERVVINGLGIVPYTIINEQWSYKGSRLRGSIINKRKLPPMTRVWEFDLKVSEDGNMLSGTFHRADKNGNFAFDSASFAWTRVK